MKILMINGTMRMGSTYHVGKLLIEKIAKEDDEICELFLPRDMPEFCRGCGVCFMESETKCMDYLMYMKRFTRLIDAADLLVFTSPVYVLHISGGMKALLDHYGYRYMFHRPEKSMFQKQAICIATAAGGGMKSALKDMKDSLFFWGVARIHTYGVAVKAISWDQVNDEIKTKIDQDTDRIVSKLIPDPQSVKPGIRTKILFYIARSMNKKNGNPADTIYWKENGWLDKERPWK